MDQDNKGDKREETIIAISTGIMCGMLTSEKDVWSGVFAVSCKKHFPPATDRSACF